MGEWENGRSASEARGSTASLPFFHSPILPLSLSPLLPFLLRPSVLTLQNPEGKWNFEFPTSGREEERSFMLTPKRIYEEELLDAGVGTDDDVEANLLDLRRINRFLGGTGVVIRALARTLDGKRADRVSLLDVGTGSADIPSEVGRWCRSRGIVATLAALDISERNIRVARTRLGVGEDLNLVRANALHLPFPARSFDYVTASLFLHHFRDDDVVLLLSEFARVARRAVIVNDLVRNLVPYYFIRLTARLILTNWMSRNDGPVSVLRGFTRAELTSLAERAGLSNCRVEREFPYRLSLVAGIGE
jgi:ubiquinone/menaquinone biosynthesis C-methylase UbiE